MLDAPLSLGAYGAAVARLQEFLGEQRVKLPASELDRAFFGPATRQAVLQFQQQNGLAARGEVDAETASLMNAAIARTSTQRPLPGTSTPSIASDLLIRPLAAPQLPETANPSTTFETLDVLLPDNALSLRSEYEMLTRQRCLPSEMKNAYLVERTNKSVASVLLYYLALEGVTYIFGVPGGSFMSLLAELKDQQKRFKYIVCRHETGAAFIADGFFRAAGKLGVVMVTSGPGATNALTGTMNADNGGSALLTITGEVAERNFGKGYLQEGIDSNLHIDAIYGAATAYSSLIVDSSSFQTLFAQALRDALSIPRRAVHISIPDNVAAQVYPSVTLPTKPENYRATPEGAPQERVSQALKLLLQAKRPLILLGSGCREALRSTFTRGALTSFVARYGIPVMTTGDGKGVFPENHDLSLRVYGCAGCTWPQYWLQPKCPDALPYDALLVLGSSLGGLSTNNWNPMLVPKGPFIQVDLNQRVIARAFDVSLGIVGEIGAFLWHLDELAKSHPPVEKEVRERYEIVARIKQKHSPFVRPDQYESDSCPMEPAAVVRVVQAALPRDAMVMLDAGNCVGWGLHYFVTDPPQEIHSSLAMGPMGFGVGTVIGAKLARPERACLALVGDGAFMMHGAEVSTASHYEIGAIWIVLLDDDLRMVSQGMAHYFPDKTEPNAWDKQYRLGKPNLVKYAEGLGADAYLAENTARLEALLERALRQADEEHRPQVIVVPIDPASVPPYFNPQYAPS
jgi:acetolactate synthase-1/2/3 large subunit